MKRKIILDLDTGTDDALALALALHSPKLEILGVTITWGNQKVTDCAMNTLRVLNYFNRSDVKVYVGESGPVDPIYKEKNMAINPGNKIYYTDDKGVIHHLHPKEFPLDIGDLKVQNEDAVSFIIDTLSNAKEKITIVPVGPATNIAKALMKKPSIVQNIEEIIFMGGSVNTGNVSKTAEANFWNDALAIKAIIDSKVKCQAMTLDATSSIPFTLENVKAFEKLGTKPALLASNIIRWRMDVSKHLGWSDGTSEAVHDPLAIAYLIDPNVITQIEKHQVDIDTSISINTGTLLIDTGSGNDNFYLATKGNQEKYFQILYDMFK